MIEWKISEKPVPVHTAIRKMHRRVDEIISRRNHELVWLLEHPHVYTGGTSAREEHLKIPDKIPVELAGRGGSYTYHGPGQRIVYVMLDLRHSGKDIKKFVWNLEEWIIMTLNHFGIFGARRVGRVGVWVEKMDCAEQENKPIKNIEFKIASIGLRLKQWISFYGFSINICPDLHYFDGIVPCGHDGYGVTSLEDLGVRASFTEFDKVLKKKFEIVFPNL